MFAYLNYDHKSYRLIFKLKFYSEIVRDQSKKYKGIVVSLFIWLEIDLFLNSFGIIKSFYAKTLLYNISIHFMSNPTKRTKYSEFIKLSPEERLSQSEYFRKKNPAFVPVVVCSKSTDLPELPNCKYLSLHTIDS